MLQRAEQIAAKSTAPRLGAVEVWFLQHLGEEFMGHFARGIGIATAATEKGDNWFVIGCTQFAERLLPGGAMAGGVAYECPAGGVKSV